MLDSPRSQPSLHPYHVRHSVWMTTDPSHADVRHFVPSRQRMERGHGNELYRYMDVGSRTHLPDPNTTSENLVFFVLEGKLEERCS